MILSHVSCFIRGEVIGFHVLMDSPYPRSTRASRWSPLVLKGEAVKIFLASVLSGVFTVWPNRENNRTWTIAESCCCLIVDIVSVADIYLLMFTRDGGRLSLKSAIGLSCLSIICPASNGEQAIVSVVGNLLT